MESLVQFVFLCVLCSSTYGVPTMVDYIPEIVPQRIPGRITQTTVALEQPLCVFDRIELSCPNCDVWLVVANNTGVSEFQSIKNGMVNSSLLTLLNAVTGPKNFYFTVKTERGNYVCPTATVSNLISTLRVGSEVPCRTPNCNAPLHTGGTFRMKYILHNPNRATANIVGETNWSGEIKLFDAVDPGVIGTRPGRRTGGMVVLTTILAILLFLLLALFAAMLALVCCKKSASTNFVQPVNTFGSLRQYHTHSLQKK
uniref:uroplakin-3b n=1 Tax=Pristiophorus japonicus TaxID=55135 RepID=UPI00398F310D